MNALQNLSDSPLEPKSILTDFKFGCINAFNNVFPNAEKRGCYFHFSQCIWKKIQKCPDILEKYKVAEFALHLRQLAALAFVPIPDVVSSFDTLMDTPFFQENDALLRPLLDYFEDTWIGRPRRRGRRKPIFEHGQWNCFLALQMVFPARTMPFKAGTIV